MGSLKRQWIAVLSISIFFMLAVDASAKNSIVSSDFLVNTADSVSIHVHRKVGTKGSKLPVLLIHGTWVDGRTWDFPGRSVMDYLAANGYDAYALDLRGMGSSDHPTNYSTIDILNRVQDAAAVATYIVANTGRVPVVAGWSQGGVTAGLLAASAPQLVAGVGFFSVPADGYFVPPQFVPLLQSVVSRGVDRYLPSPDVLFAIAFAIDPLTGQPTISPGAFATFVSLSQPDSVRAILESVSPDFFAAALLPAWPKIKVPTLVVDGALDLLVGKVRAQALFDALGSKQKQIVILPRNGHGWFLEDSFAQFLAQF